MELTLSCAEFATPSPLYPVRPKANTDLHLAIWRWKKEELALPSSESRAQMEFFYPISFSSYHIRLSNTILCKAVSGTRMCTWWINQQKKKKNAGIVSCYIQVWLSARCGRLHFSPSGLVFCTTECKEIEGREKHTVNKKKKYFLYLHLKTQIKKQNGWKRVYCLRVCLLKHTTV